MDYYGWQVYPGLLRTRAEGYTAHGDALADIKKTLKALLDDDAFLGDDEAGNAFRSQTYRPMLDKNIYKSLDDLSDSMHGFKKNLNTMADNYQKADKASKIQA